MSDTSESSGFKKQRTRRTRKIEVFAYPTDDTGLPLRVEGFPPIPAALLDHTRREMKELLLASTIFRYRTTVDADAAIEWAISNPSCPGARVFRHCLRRPLDVICVRQLEAWYAAAAAGGVVIKAELSLQSMKHVKPFVPYDPWVHTRSALTQTTDK